MIAVKHVVRPPKKQISAGKERVEVAIDETKKKKRGWNDGKSPQRVQAKVPPRFQKDLTMTSKILLHS